jgi:chemotaxis protein CheX
MQIGNDTIHQVVESIWTAVLGWPVEPGDPPPEETGEGDVVTGCVQISGAWAGAVLLDYPAELAREAAALLFGGPAAGVTREQVCDVVGELTNILAGNFKALVPEPSRLNLPTVTETARPAPPEAGRLVIRVAFRCQECTFLVSMVEYENPHC